MAKRTVGGLAADAVWLTSEKQPKASNRASMRVANWELEHAPITALHASTDCLFGLRGVLDEALSRRLALEQDILRCRVCFLAKMGCLCM